MKPERYQQIRKLFDDAQNQSDTWLQEAARDDIDLLAAVRRLLAASDRGGPMLDAASPVFELQPATVPFKWEARRLGPYEIESQLGEGGMGVVYLGKRADGAFRKQVAIKVLRSELATPNFIARFQREREILAQLEHPNIARLLDGGSASGGVMYLVMEYVNGEPLIEYADSRNLTYDARLHLARQIAEAVDYAHAQGVIHRDLKPSNIFVTRDGQVKLLDFGIAAWHHYGQDSEQSPTIALSPAYASPEQARGEATTKASDVYSFAMVTYELLAGILPFPIKGVSLQQVLETVAAVDVVPPSVAVERSTNPQPAELGARRRIGPWKLMDHLRRTADRPLLRALSKHREDRQSTTRALVDELTVKPMVSVSWSKQVVSRVNTSLDLTLLAVIAATFAVTGELSAKPGAWVVLVLVLGVGLFRRQGSLFGNYALAVPVIAGLMIYGGSWMMALFALLIGGEIYPHYRRFTVAGRLGSTLATSGSSRNFYLYCFVVDLVAVVCLVGAWYDMSLVFQLWFTFRGLGASYFKKRKVEIRARGIACGLQELPWSKLEAYWWEPNAILAIRSESGDVRVHVEPEVKEKFDIILRNRLQEW